METAPRIGVPSQLHSLPPIDEIHASGDPRHDHLHRIRARQPESVL